MKHAQPADPVTVRAYSEQAAARYEHPVNRNFLYGAITARFLATVRLAPGDREIVDIGCGSGAVFDALRCQFDLPGRTGIGIDPAPGMLRLAAERFRGDARFSFRAGAFERIPLPDRSADRIISTLALHWVPSLEPATAEMRRVLRDNGAVDLCMVARDDGARFRRAVAAALRRHLGFGQMRDAAQRIRRVTAEELVDACAPFRDRFAVEPVEHRQVIFGSFEDHMRWWTARSAPVIAEVADRSRLMEDLRAELEKLSTPRGIPFDAAWLDLRIRPR